MTENTPEEMALMLDLLNAGVPWYLARETIATTRLSKEDK